MTDCKVISQLYCEIGLLLSAADVIYSISGVEFTDLEVLDTIIKTTNVSYIVKHQ